MDHTLVFHTINLAKKLQKSIGFKSLALSYSQASALLVLGSQNNLSQRELASWLHLEPATVVNLIDELERLKLVKREKPDSDRRKYHIVLTIRGKAKAKQIKDRTHLLDKLLVSQLTDSQASTFMSVLNKLSDYLETLKGGENEIPGTKRSLAA